MKYEEIMKDLREGKQIINEDWNGTKLKKKIMYIALQKPDENSKNTEPYIMMYVGTYLVLDEKLGGGWKFVRFPWTPSALDIFSENWKVRKNE